jgi:hypothetical protein
MKDWNYHRKIGHVGVLAVRKELTMMGWNIAEPDVDCGVDLIIWRDGSSFIRVQVKTCVKGYKTSLGAKFLISRVKYKKKSRHGYSENDCDFIICHCLSNKGFWVIPILRVAGKLKMSVGKDDDFYKRWDYLESFSPLLNKISETTQPEPLIASHIIAEKVSEIKRLKNNISGIKNRMGKIMKIAASYKSEAKHYREEISDLRCSIKNSCRESRDQWEFIRYMESVREYRNWRPSYTRQQQELDRQGREWAKKIDFGMRAA